MSNQISNNDGAQSGASLPPRTGSADACLMEARKLQRAIRKFILSFDRTFDPYASFENARRQIGKTDFNMIDLTAAHDDFCKFLQALDDEKQNPPNAEVRQAAGRKPEKEHNAGK